ncbi:MAG TPA: EamA family transporter RarD [Mycobacterium sp.]|nr:EamA family transporter RarD [Mycobacterium sp.]HQC76300.1 EamA family transporter RarD [Mycobacterium sp.]
MTRTATAGRNTDAAGLLFGLGAYGIWGVFPGFFPLLQPAGPGEILAHRVVWTLALMAVLLVVTRRLGDLRGIDRRTWLLLACASVLISTNWLIYIYAVNSHRVVDAALGYYINPLVSVLIGVVLFRERLNRAQLLALLIALAAVVLLVVGVGDNPLIAPPWIALGLAFSFGLYGAVKKVVRVEPRVSVTVETAIAAPFAVIYLVGLQISGASQFTNHGPGHVALMLLCGPVTAVPLLFFAAAAQRLPLITIGLLQYLTPSMQLTWGLLIGDEPMSATRWAGFALIWFALAIFTTDGLLRTYRGRTGILQAS